MEAVFELLPRLGYNRKFDKGRMKKILCWLAGIVLVAVLAVGGYLLYWVFKSPKAVPPKAIRVAVTPEKLARGRYLMTAVVDCFGCHAERDWSRFDGPIIPGTEGVGGPMPLEGFPGELVVPNITPDPETGIGAWTDGEILRAFREGIGRDGRALFPLMPYPYYRHMSDEDAEAIVAYLRSLPPVKKKQRPTRIDFPVSLFIKSAPAPAGTAPEPNRADRLAYGKYLTTIAGCKECHTPDERGTLIPGKEFAGGRLFAFAGSPLRVYTANITPENDTGIGVWTEERFIRKFRSYLPYAEGESPKVGPESFTLMPWLAFCRMTDDDLKAIYAYLRTVKPVYNAVEKYKGLGSQSGN